jgi:hypothetical protein
MRRWPWLGAALLVGACTSSPSTTVMTGPDGERWDAQAMVGHCFTTTAVTIDDVPCSALGAREAIHVGHSERECPARATGAWTWPAQGPNPTIVVCFG